MAGVTARIRLGVTAAFSKVLGSGVSRRLPYIPRWDVDLSAGTGDGQANCVYHTTVTMASGDTDASIDLTAVTDDFGDAINFAGIRALGIKHTSGTLSVTIAGTGQTLIQGVVPAGCWVFAAGSVGLVPVSSPFTLTFEKTAGSAVTLEVFIIGTRSEE